MRDRCVSPDYDVRGQPFELWTDGWSNPGMYPNWWLVRSDDTKGFPGLPERTVLTGEEAEFDPPLSAREVEAIGDSVLSYLTF